MQIFYNNQDRNNKKTIKMSNQINLFNLSEFSFTLFNQNANVLQ